MEFNRLDSLSVCSAAGGQGYCVPDHDADDKLLADLVADGVEWLDRTLAEIAADSTPAAMDRLFAELRDGDARMLAWLTETVEADRKMRELAADGG